MFVHKNVSARRRLDYLNKVELPLLRVDRLYANKNYYSLLLKKNPKLLVVYGINNHTTRRPKSRAEVACGTLTLLLPYLRIITVRLESSLSVICNGMI